MSDKIVASNFQDGKTTYYYASGNVIEIDGRRITLHTAGSTKPVEFSSIFTELE